MAIGKFMNNFYIPVMLLFYRTLCVFPACGGIISLKNCVQLLKNTEKQKAFVISKAYSAINSGFLSRNLQ